MKRTLALALAYAIPTAIKAIENPNASCHVPSIILPSDIEPTSHGQKVVIAHRGASAHLPEHSLEGYRLALEMGADYVEPDLVATKDGQLIAIHSMDLSITTDVDEKFPDRQTFSKYMNQTGYWSYEFTLEEMLTLRIKQRLPEARTQRFDGMLQIPTLTQILELVHEWNTVIAIKRVKRTHAQSAVRGVYAELKDFPWLLDDTGHDLVDLLFQHIDDNDALWQKSIIDNHCYTKRLTAHEYRLPPLVIQSFEGDALKYFVNTWNEKFNKNETIPLLPPPPTVLLVNSDECLADSFWFRVEERYRNILSGIGPDKSCLGYRWRDFMQRATKSNLAVHPWTARPELEFFSKPSNGVLPFDNVLEEIQYLFCEVAVHGIFSESVDTAVLASALPCPPPTTTTTGSGKRSKGGGVCENVCSQSMANSQFFVGFSSFAMGIIITILILYLVQGIKLHSGGRERVPTEEVNDNILDNKAHVDDDSAFSDKEMEML
ncbi:unnamed protein product [Cylindrotheca closterium]|uniref:glycerophosphodiester phosphodiesterase n=1 Tax=Cylindrotheca closterium TaxID=2856 RepID=A0AAD2FLM5_9STRA|nr:unnamed protein product [Cylindrotheca closterium]